MEKRKTDKMRTAEDILQEYGTTIGSLHTLSVRNNALRLITWGQADGWDSAIDTVLDLVLSRMDEIMGEDTLIPEGLYKKLNDDITSLRIEQLG